jgi:hypothetical protein
MYNRNMKDQVFSTPSITSKLPEFLTTVTPLSKFIAMTLFIILPFVGFYFGYKYGQLTLPLLLPIPTIFPKPTISPNISTWKTYTNPKYGYSIKYPPNLQPITYPGDVSTHFFNKTTNPEATYVSEQSFNIDVLDNPNKLPFHTWLDTSSLYEPYMKSSADVKEISIGGKTWYTSNDSTTGLLGLPPNIEFRWFYSNGGKVYLFSNEAFRDDKTTLLILSTFKQP